jgi:Inorganic pyrophosphatase
VLSQSNAEEDYQEPDSQVERDEDFFEVIAKAHFPACSSDAASIESEQKEDGQRQRNDRIVAVEQAHHTYAHVKHVRDLGKKFVRELKKFLVNYHQLSGRKYKVLDVRGPGEARRRVRDGINAPANLPDSPRFVLTTAKHGKSGLACSRTGRLLRRQLRNNKFLKNIRARRSAYSDQRVLERQFCAPVLRWVVEIRDAARGQIPEQGRVVWLPTLVVSLADH